MKISFLKHKIKHILASEGILILIKIKFTSSDLLVKFSNIKLVFQRKLN